MEEIRGLWSVGVAGEGEPVESGLDGGGESLSEDARIDRAELAPLPDR